MREGPTCPLPAMNSDCQPYLPFADLPQARTDFSPSLVDGVMGRFDFLRVRTAMEALGWTYFGESAAPSVETLKVTARGLLEEAAREKTEGVQHQSGGFCASWTCGGALFLTFEIANSHASQATPFGGNDGALPRGTARGIM